MMRLPTFKRTWWLVAIGLVVASAAYLGLGSPRRRIPNRVYRIAWQQVPPFQQLGNDGFPTGLAVELVRAGARNRGIRLEWVFYTGRPETALRNHEVDLWTLTTVIPERKGVIHITEPYLRHETDLLVRAGSPYFRVDDLATATVSELDLPINRILVRRILPDAHLVTTPTLKEAVEQVCAHRSDAVFLDEFTGVAALLSGLSCEGQPLRVIPLPMLPITLGVGASLDLAAVADEIRSGMDATVKRPDFAKMLTSWGYFSPDNMAYLSALVDAHQREKWLIGTVGVFAVLLAITIFAANRIRLQRDRIERAEEALRQSDNQLRLLADNLSEMVLAYDMSRQLVFVNSAVERLTGYSPEALRQAEPLSWVYPGDRLRMLKRWETLFEGGTYKDEEYRLVAQDGSMKWAMASWGPIYDDAGRQVGVQGSEREITARKVAEQALRESERTFRELLEGVTLVAIVIDRHGVITFCNDYTLATTGWSRDEVVGHPADKFLDRRFLRQLTQDPMVKSGVSAQPYLEGGILTKQGGRRWIQWSTTALRDSTGESAGFASLGADITELRTLRAEAARRESDQRFQNMADTAPLMVWVTGVDKGRTFVNKGWLSFTGRSPEQALGYGWIDSVHPDDRESYFNSYVAAFDERQPVQIEHRLRRADGEYRWVLATGVPRFGPDGEFSGYVGNTTDITNLKRSQEEDVARQKLESVGRLANGIAHDFNNLLGGVLAQADLAMTELAEGAHPEEQLNNIRAVATRGAGIVRQLMIYAGQESTVSEPVDVSHLIDDLRELLHVVISKHASLVTELAAGLSAVRANPAQLRQLVMNLVTNASEAIGENDGVISIRTEPIADGPDLPPGGAGAWVLLEVSDTGCGMTLEERARVFDPFFTTKTAGHGLGLAVVQGIVRGLGGVIQLDSEPGRGSTFRVLLPSAIETAQPSKPAGISPVAEQVTDVGMVLVVEDEPTLRMAATRMLRMSGFAVLEAEDGTVALSLVREQQNQIALMLLDITLPGAPSRDVFAEARRVRPDVRVIVTSAYGPNVADEAFPGLEVDAFIRKPYQLRTMVSLVREVLSG
ncbi:MAG TPA: PAS domain S-box protein [Candidatus Acidoferrum sp.]|nr:PAS domain S-box protein [Candidatus Acidoferrum sp.]